MPIVKYGSPTQKFCFWAYAFGNPRFMNGGCWVQLDNHLWTDERLLGDCKYTSRFTHTNWFFFFFFVAKIQIDVTAYTSRQHYNDKVMIKHKGCFIWFYKCPHYTEVLIFNAKLVELTCFLRVIPSNFSQPLILTLTKVFQFQHMSSISIYSLTLGGGFLGESGGNGEVYWLGGLKSKEIGIHLIWPTHFSTQNQLLQNKKKK